MQLMTWMMARLGSRFSLVFEPYKRRVLHSAVGRFLDQPLSFSVGLIEPNGTRRILPFAAQSPGVTDLYNCEQFERFNSITFRGFSEKYRLRFEFNIHAVFYPQDERLCIMPAFYLEVRVNPVDSVRLTEPHGDTPESVKVFLQLSRPHADIHADTESDARIELSYVNRLEPRVDVLKRQAHTGNEVSIQERIVSLNPGCVAASFLDGAGLEYELPVTESGSGTKWRLVWAAHTSDPILRIGSKGQMLDAAFRYNAHWADVDEVVREAIETRDDRLAHSRRFEKLLEQSPVQGAERHLVNQSFQTFLSNTFWCDAHAQGGTTRQWFSVWDGAYTLHSPIDVEYNTSMLYLAIWPGLLAMQFGQWAEHEINHELSGGSYLSRDLGYATAVTGQGFRTRWRSKKAAIISCCFRRTHTGQAIKRLRSNRRI